MITEEFVWTVLSGIVVIGSIVLVLFYLWRVRKKRKLD